MPTLDTPDEIRDFLRLCTAPRAGFPGRTVAELAKVMPPWLADKLTDHAPKVAALREVAELAHAAYLSALTDWITTATTADPVIEETPLVAAVPGMCPQNLFGDRAVPGEHYRPDPAGPCVFCQSGQAWVFNARSVSRTTKHARGGDGLTLCPSSHQATAPMTDDRAARLGLCPGCRRALIDNAEGAYR